MTPHRDYGWYKMTGLYGFDRGDVLDLIIELWNKTVEKANGDESKMIIALRSVLDEEAEKIANRELEIIQEQEQKAIAFKMKNKIAGR